MSDEEFLRSVFQALPRQAAAKGMTKQGGRKTWQEVRAAAVHLAEAEAKKNADDAKKDNNLEKQD